MEIPQFGKKITDITLIFWELWLPTSFSKMFLQIPCMICLCNHSNTPLINICMDIDTICHVYFQHDHFQKQNFTEIVRKFIIFHLHNIEQSFHQRFKSFGIKFQQFN